MKILVVVDYQNDFVDGALGFDGAEKLDQGIAQKIREYHKSGNIIIETKDTHRGNYMETREGKNLPIPHCIKGTQGHKTYGETGKIMAELIMLAKSHARNKKKPLIYGIEKETFGVHPDVMSDILDWLYENKLSEEDIKTIEFVGLVSNICVISNICVFQAAFPEAQIILDSNLTASHDPKAHEAVLEVMKGLQVKFINSDNN